MSSSAAVEALVVFLWTTAEGATLRILPVWWPSVFGLRD